ncbi:hypothetical protein AYJ57_15250 [Salipiger sp. CCB-MM3]|uniref:hypothetical protein n=1 Tax=Salipiger sp. CCB-MM3 TaxID=1792508 RepID=UPI00080AB096|nr:hypothetical protein [Salipiger sp. CCB-MM3]ANT61822.1 hypothetical protein AYJ57_15250 [Salipiger sp. CCB-MM3]
MKADTVFAPAQRVDFGEALLPPEGYRLEAALGTTFSMDFLTALTVPVSLALRGGVQREELLASPLAALAAMRRLEDRVTVCVEAGNIHPPAGKRTALVSLLEGLVREVSPPKGASFHPKLWLLRFAPEDGGPMRQRLIMMSRNLTRDRSWDVALRLEGEEKAEHQRANAPLVGLIDWLPVEKNSHLRGLRDGLQHVRWERVPGFSPPLFHAHHPLAQARDLWRPGRGQLAVISPFCDDAGLGALGRDRIQALVACDDWLAALKSPLPRSLMLADHGLPEPDPEAAFSAEDRAGLHAKLYVLEQGEDTVITLGSGNATSAGLGLNGPRNIEVFASLRGRTTNIGGIGLDGAGILGVGGIGPLLQDWMPRAPREDEIAAKIFNDAVRAARHAIIAAGAKLSFAPLEDRLSLNLSLVLPDLPDIAEIRAQLVTRDNGVLLQGAGPWDLGSVRLADATSFVQFDLCGLDGERAGFVTNLEAEGLPEGDARLKALLSDIVRTPEQFLSFVAAMLEQRPDIEGMIRAASEGGGSARGTRPVPPVLETMLAAYLDDDGPARLRDLDRVVGLMGRDLGGEVMREFLNLWGEFKTALGKAA